MDVFVPFHLQKQHSHEMGDVISLFKLNCRTKKSQLIPQTSTDGAGSWSYFKLLFARYLKQAILRPPLPPAYLLLTSSQTWCDVHSNTYCFLGLILKGTSVQPATITDGVKDSGGPNRPNPRPPQKQGTPPQTPTTWACRLVCHDLTFYTFEKWTVHWTGMNWNGLVKKSHGFMDSDFLSNGAFSW